MTLTKSGYAVEIKREDGPTFLAWAGPGQMPFVTFYRKQAVEWKRRLKEHGLNGRVVPVLFADPVVADPNKKASE